MYQKLTKLYFASDVKFGYLLATRRLEYSLEILLGLILELNNGKHNCQQAQRLKSYGQILIEIFKK